jgi:hypothetical protein
MALRFDTVDHFSGQLSYVAWKIRLVAMATHVELWRYRAPSAVTWSREGMHKLV